MVDNPNIIGPTAVPLPRAEEPETTSWQGFINSFILENDVVNTWDFLTWPVFPRDENFLAMKDEELKKRGLLPYREYFLDTHSIAELDYMEQRFRLETFRREKAVNGGWPGFLGGLAGGALSPTMFIPLIGEARGAKAAFQAAVFAGGAGALQELPLQLNQEQRTAFESATSILAQTVIGGVLGRLAAGADERVLRKAAYDMGNSTGELTIPNSIAQGGDTAVKRIKPITGTYRVGKEFDEAADTPHISPYGRDSAAHVYEYTPKRALVVSPESLAFVGKTIDDLAEIVKQAKIEGFDSIIVEEVNPKVDGIMVLDKSVLTKVDGPVPAQHPRFGTGMEDVVIPRNSQTGNLGAASARVDLGKTKQNWLTRATMMDKATEFVSPVTRVVESSFQTARNFMRNIADAGLRYEGPIVEGATIENRVYAYRGEMFNKLINASDEAFDQYLHKGAGPKIAAAFRNHLTARNAGKLTRKEWNEAAWRYAHSEDASVPAEVRAFVDKVRAEILDPLAEEAQAAGLMKLPDEIVGDANYIMRVPNPVAISQDYNGLVDVLADHYENTVLKPKFAERMEKYRKAQAKDEQFIADASMSEEEVTKLLEEFAEEQKTLDKKLEKFYDIDDSIAEIRHLLKKEKDNPLTEIGADGRTKPTEAGKRVADLKKTLKTYEALYPQERADLSSRKLEIKKRVSNLNKSAVVYGQKQAAKLAKIERAEELQINTLTRAAYAARKMIADIDKVAPEKIAKLLSAAKTKFAQVGEDFDELEIKLLKLEEIPARLENKLDDLSSSLNQLTDRIDDLEGLDPAEAKQYFTEVLGEYLKRANSINSRRAVRAQKLREQVKELTPEKAKEFIDARKGKMRERTDKLRAVVTEEMKGEGFDPVTGEVSFKDTARDAAHVTAKRMGNIGNRLPILDAINLTVEQRGPEIARVLTIPTARIEKWLESDFDKILRIYIRTLTPDIEIAKRFGDVNASTWFDDITEEFNLKMDGLKTAVDKDGKPLDAKAKEKQSDKITKEYQEVTRVLQAQLSRLRHLWGIPQNPDGFAYRAGRAMMDLNTMRYMGMVTISSLADPGRIVMKHGLTRTLRDGFIPLIRNFKQFKLAAKVAKQFGEALDVVIHTRAHAFSDITEDYMRGSKFERTLSAAASRMGVYAGFDYWTAGMKQLASVVQVSRMVDDITAVMEGTATKAQIDYLASMNIDGEWAGKIYKELTTANGGVKFNGRWWPNTDYWMNEETKRVFGAALNGESRNTIITPGLERPLIMDQNLAFKMLFQFKSFALSSLTKTVMAGMQQADMAVINGTLFSLALGSFSYYLWAIAVGGDAYEEMMSAGPDKWADEAISRSGMLGPGSEALKIGQRLPWLDRVSSFSGARTENAQGADLIQLLAGPSFSLLNNVFDAMVGLDNPTRHTLHSASQVVPLRNHLIFRRFLDALENQSGLPESRRKQ